MSPSHYCYKSMVSVFNRRLPPLRFSFVILFNILQSNCVQKIQIDGIKMDPDRSQVVCIPIKFNRLNRFCDVDSTNLTQESFLNDVSSVVPKAMASPKFELTVFDESNVLVPFSLLKKVITTYMHRRGFHLKIEFVQVHRNHTTDNDVLPNNAFQSYLIANHLKHILVKGEKYEDNLNKGDIIELIKAAYNFLICQYGPNPKLPERKSLAEILHKQFPQLDPRMIFKKLTQRAKNRNRLPNVKKSSSRPKVRISTILSSGENNGDGEGQSNDYDDLLTAYEIK